MSVCVHVLMCALTEVRGVFGSGCERIGAGLTELI